MAGQSGTTRQENGKESEVERLRRVNAEQAAAIAELQDQMRAMQSSIAAAQETQRKTAQEAQRKAAQLQQEENRRTQHQTQGEGEQLAQTEAARLVSEREYERERIIEAAKRAAEQAAMAIMRPELSPASSMHETLPVSGLQGQPVDDASAQLALITTMDTLPKFTGLDPVLTVRKWIARVNEDAEINGWNEHQKFLAARRALTESARTWYDSQSGIRSWDLLQKGLTESFGRRATAADIHEKLRNRKRKKEEPLTKFIKEMELLASQSDLTEREIRGYIAKGFTENTHARASLRSVANKEQFMSLLEIYDEDDNFCNGKKKCFSCGEEGHIQRNCRWSGDRKYNKDSQQPQGQDRPRPRLSEIKCFRCDEIGHYASDCPQKAKSEILGSLAPERTL